MRNKADQQPGEHASVRTPFRFAVITMSDKGARGEREDTSGPALRNMLGEQGFECCHYTIVPDDRARIVAEVLKAIEVIRADLVVTTGGTGVAPSDVTPEAMDEILEKEVPGIAEAMRAASFAITPRAVISRGRSGIRGQSLVINLPGSKKAAVENLLVVLPALDHILEKIKGDPSDCAVSTG